MTKSEARNANSLASLAWYRLWQRLLQFVAVLVYRVRYYGRENIPAGGGVLVVSNHQSHFDPPLVGIGCPRQMNYVARETLFRFAPFGWFIHSVGSIPIDRDGIGLSGIKESLRRLKRGEMVLIFPEGTRTRDGEIAPFRPGFTALAVRSGAAILPVAIDGGVSSLAALAEVSRPGPHPRPLRRAHYARRNCRPRRARVAGRSRAPRPPVPPAVKATWHCLTPGNRAGDNGAWSTAEHRHGNPRKTPCATAPKEQCLPGPPFTARPVPSSGTLRRDRCADLEPRTGCGLGGRRLRPAAGPEAIVGKGRSGHRLHRDGQR